MDCPNPNPSPKGGGKGKGKLGSFEGQEPDWEGSNEEESIRYLSSLTLKRPPIPTSNYWAGLQAKEEMDTPTGVPEQASAALSSAGSVSAASAGTWSASVTLVAFYTPQVLIRVSPVDLERVGTLRVRAP